MTGRSKVSDRPRGWCPVCEREMTLTKTGTLRHHGGPVGSGPWEDYRSYQCKGAGQMPGVKPEVKP